MNREQALKLLDEKLTNKNLVKHSLAVEAVMRALARHFGEDEEIWGMAGLLHDLDYEVTKDDWTKHGLIAEEWLKEYNLPKEIFEIGQDHNAEAWGREPKSKAGWAIYATDPLTGLITATALMNPEKKIANISTESVLKKFKNLKFAAGANREHIKACENTGLSLEDFINVSLKAMQSIDKDLGL